MAIYWDNRKGERGAKGIAGWWFRIILKGRRHEGHGYLSQEDAAEAERTARRVAQGLEAPVVQTTFHALAIEYFRLCEIQNTKIHYKHQWYRYQGWLAVLGDAQVSELTPVQISQYVRRWAKAQSNATANRNLDMVKLILRTGVDQGLIDYTDGLHRILRLKRLPVTKNEKYVPPREDLLTVYLRCNQRDRCLLDVYLGTLARKRELLDLEWSAVDLDNQNLILSTRKTRGGNTKRTLVPMTNEVFKALTWVNKNRLSDIWVFPSPKTRRPYHDRNKWFMKICREAGVKHFSFHSLRHYSSNLASNRGAQARQSQELLRHDNLTTTDTYLQSIRGIRPETMGLMEDPLGLKTRKKKSHTK